MKVERRRAHMGISAKSSTRIGSENLVFKNLNNGRDALHVRAINRHLGYTPALQTIQQPIVGLADDYRGQQGNVLRRVQQPRKPQ
jgi:hypothetical protein